jgi:phytoene desaturase
MNNTRQAVVIGAGIAGMAVAIRLAIQGWQVRVFEKNSYPGGKLSWFEQNGYSFDAGPSLFTQPQLIEELFRQAGEPIADYFNYKASEVACSYFFENGKKVIGWAHKEKFATEMEAQLGENPAQVLKYLNQSANTYNHIGRLFLDQSLHRWRKFRWLKVRNALAYTKRAFLFQSLHQYNQSFFKTPEATQLFNRYATYNGSNPYKAPAMLSLIPHLEMNDGTYYPRGGMISITRALHQLALKKGVQFVFDTGVQRIIEHAGVARGIVVNEANIMADIVVSNCDAYFTYKNLLAKNEMAAKVLKQERSSSALIFYWGIGQSFPQLGLHNILFSHNYEQEFHHLFSTRSFYTDPTVYINITSKMETGQAPPGKENWFVMINAPAHVGQPWHEWIPQARQRIVEKINRTLHTQIENYIETESVLDPTTIESRTTSYMGSLYGTSSNSKMAAFLRHPNFSKSIKGLYFVGGSVHPGGGIPLCLHSAAIAAGLVRDDFGAPAPDLKFSAA